VTGLPDSPLPGTPAPEGIELELTLRPDPDASLGRYILGFEGQARVWDDAQGEERPVGTIRGHRIDLVSALHDGLGQQEILESLTPEIAEFAGAVLGDTQCLLPACEADSLTAEDCDGLVYVAELRVEPGYRGRGIGSELLRRLGSTIDLERCLIALKALPLRDDPAARSTPEEVARVKRFYLRHGFEHAGEEYMVKDARRCEAAKKRLAGRRTAARG
jgi:GNAT superfamily N-acetyltransferase